VIDRVFCFLASLGLGQAVGQSVFIGFIEFCFPFVADAFIKEEEKDESIINTSANKVSGSL